ncbi:Hpt domain-containing protein [Vibrio coralliilyticus]|uniref:Hpt domain-containing protein n=1 Tax=Vibrio coralliilyticus TaxID=190893 RepID=UPI00156100F2|nr:Hpt domain-containing protein [Vibrio coralliilyticus]NRF60716.1 Hpt domain-containing protein [Vibrio coralliilyticus]
MIPENERLIIQQETLYFIQELCDGDVDDALGLIGELSVHANTLIKDSDSKSHLDSAIHKISGSCGVMGFDTLAATLKHLQRNASSSSLIAEQFNTMLATYILLIKSEY